eukprot:COSAG01_NODE_3769_length_5716_cov_10.341641_7_plen_151_part_00
MSEPTVSVVRSDLWYPSCSAASAWAGVKLAQLGRACASRRVITSESTCPHRDHAPAESVGKSQSLPGRVRSAHTCVFGGGTTATCDVHALVARQASQSSTASCSGGRNDTSSDQRRNPTASQYYTRYNNTMLSYIIYIIILIWYNLQHII